jgi:4-amino-4-deoxy-L-arabinose transferase-like glycosyltransferase
VKGLRKPNEFGGTRSGDRFDRRAIVQLVAILLLGFALRLGWLLTQVTAIGPDGAEYATIAEHLRRQQALIGIYEGPSILYAPLYSVLIAAVMTVVPNSETAAHVVSLASGMALIVIVFFLANLLYGRRAAYTCAAIAAAHPLLIALSATAYNEALYMTLWITMAARRHLSMGSPLRAKEHYLSTASSALGLVSPFRS